MRRRAFVSSSFTLNSTRSEKLLKQQDFLKELPEFQQGFIMIHSMFITCILLAVYIPDHLASPSDTRSPGGMATANNILHRVGCVTDLLSVFSRDHLRFLMPENERLGLYPYTGFILVNDHLPLYLQQLR